MQIFKPEFDSYFHLLKIMVIKLRQRKQKFNSPSNENHKTVFFYLLASYLLPIIFHRNPAFFKVKLAKKQSK